MKEEEAIKKIMRFFKEEFRATPKIEILPNVVVMNILGKKPQFRKNRTEYEIRFTDYSEE